MIDITFLMYSDTPLGKDPDTHSYTLSRYHQTLWSKQLFSGDVFELVVTTKPPYNLWHNSQLGNFVLASDSIIHTFTKWKRMEHIIKHIGEGSLKHVINIASTIGGYIIFPANKIDNKPTINASRGFNKHINDRFDLTLECIRMWYSNIENPLSETRSRYKDFLNLFRDFKGYVDYFLLNDLVSCDYERVNFWLPVNGFTSDCTLPKTIDECTQYIQNAIGFVYARNKRILEKTQLQL